MLCICLLPYSSRLNAALWGTVSFGCTDVDPPAGPLTPSVCVSALSSDAHLPLSLLFSSLALLTLFNTHDLLGGFRRRLVVSK